jgi:type II secretory pathway component GspD/PulD (secretin)
MKILQATRWQSIPGGLLLALLILPAGALAQGGSRSLIEHLEQQDVQAELNLSAAQQQQLEELRAFLSDRSGMAEMMKKSTQVTTDEERNQLREQMRSYAANRRQQAEEKLEGMLSAEQLKKLKQIALQERGLEALADDDLATLLELTDEQRQTIAQLTAQRAAAESETDLQTDEQFDQFEAQWDARYAAVLTDEQQQQWTDMSGTPISGAAAAPLAAQPSLQTAPADGGTDGGVASFGAPRRASSEPRDPDKLYFTFQNSPWSEVLPLFAEAAGLTLDLHAIPPGTFSHIDNRGYTVTEALDVINGYLLARGYILVRREGGFLVSIRIDDPSGIPPNLVPTVSASELPTRGRNELLTVVFPVTSSDDVDAVASEVEKLVGRQGKVVGVKPTRSIVVTDIGANLQRINELLRTVTGGPEDPVFKEYALQHILADDAEFLVRTLLGLSTDSAAAAAASAAASAQSEEQRRREERASRFSRGGSTPFGFGGRQPTSPAPTTSGATNRSGSKANTIADPRTNKLLVSATPSEHRIIEEALKTVDVSERSPLASDRPYGSLGDKQMTVVGLSSMDATSAALMLQSMFLKEGDNAPTISANVAARQLIVRGSEAQLYQIKQLLMELGEDGSGQRTASNRGPVRSVNLSGRDPSELLPILERMWASQRGSTLRVVVPGATNTGAQDEDEQRRSQILRDLQQRLQDQSDPRPQRPQRPGADDDDSRTEIDGPVSMPAAEDLFTVGTEAPAGDNADGTSTVQAPAAETRTTTQGDVTLRIVGDELMIISQDEQALDELEMMIENVMRAVPPRTTWSIFPLKSADATEAAAMLEQLFPDSRVSQSSTDSGGTLGALTSGISSFGSGVANLTGLSELGSGPQTLRIIPETRLNALWVSGPTYKVQEVEQMLEIIDSSGLTESLRDRVPRLIKVEHADIDDVFEIVSSVYAPEMQAIGAPGGDPRQAFAAMLGGRRGGDDDNNRNAQARAPQITLGIDKDTSHLIVSASDGTFAEIKELVESIDLAAQSARRSVMVRQLVNTNASTVQGSLTSIIPKVTVSTTGSNARPSTSGSSSGSQSQGSSSSSDDDARRRAEFFQRMREQGGGGGFSPFGGGGGDRGGRGSTSRGGRSSRGR